MKMKTTFNQIHSLLVRKSLILLAALTLGIAHAWATDYVISYNGGYLGVSSNGQITYTSTLTESCIWTCSSGNLSSSTSYNIYTTVNATKYWLKGTENGAISVQTSEPGNKRWRSDDNNYLIYYKSSNNYYAYYDNAWKTSNSSSTYSTYLATISTPNKATVTLGVSSANGGNGTVAISSSSTAGSYGSTASLTQYYTSSSPASFTIFAKADENYDFVGWTSSATGTTATDGTDNPQTLSVSSSSATYYAIFKKKQTQATVNVAISSKSATTSDVSVSVTDGSATAAGSAATLTQTDDSGNPVDKTFTLWTTMGATAQSGHYYFAGWANNDNTETISIASGATEYVATTNKTTTVATGDNATYNYYAIFKQFPWFGYEVSAIPTLDGKVDNTVGTVSTYIIDNSVSAAAHQTSPYTYQTTSTTEKSHTVEAWFTVSPATGYALAGWSKANDGTVDYSTSGNYSESLTNTTENTTLSRTLYAIFYHDSDPQVVEVTPTTVTLDKGQTQQLTVTYTPDECFKKYTFASADATIATVSETGLITGVKQGTTTVTVTIYRKNGVTVYKTMDVPVTVMDKLPAPIVTITQIGTTDEATVTLTPADGTPAGAKIYYTTNSDDTSVAPADPTSSSTEYTAAFTIKNQVSVKAIAVCDGWYSSDIASGTFIMRVTATPVIHISTDGAKTVSFTCDDDSEGGIFYYYTTDGSTPTYDTSTGDATGTTTKLAGTATGTASFDPGIVEGILTVIATHEGWNDSPAVQTSYVRGSGTGTDSEGNGIVYLNDLEDHNWSYYTGEETTVGSTKETYKEKYLYTLYSPDPRNVKITYKGVDLNRKLGSNVKVSPSETENQFVYYKTVEKYKVGFFTDDNGNGLPDDIAQPSDEAYAYTVISNPFSVRPSTGSGNSKIYYGFAGWKVTSGHEYIKRADGTACAENAVLNLDEIIHFINLDNNYTPNCISAEIEFEATWNEATVKTGTTAQSFSGGTYETNFFVVTGDIGSTTTSQQRGQTVTTINGITQSSPCTITAMYPDGTNDNSANYTILALTVEASHVKVEYIRHGGGNFDANGHNLTLGRGITSSTSAAQGTVYGRKNDVDCVNIVKIESGYYERITNLSSTTVSEGKNINCYVIMGCDYDRALANYYTETPETDGNAYNIKLRSKEIYGVDNSKTTLNREKGQLYMRGLIKSGVFCEDTDDYYYIHTRQDIGQRFVEMEGGYIKGCIRGGSDGDTGQAGYRAMGLRMHNGRVDAQIGCGSTYMPCSGDRVIVITGGLIGGWLAPGSNTESTNGSGETDGESFVYFGGTAEINSRHFNDTNGETLLGYSTGGAIYGAGLGLNSTLKNGLMKQGSNIVFADDAYCERGIYGGGALGITNATAHIFILGGRIGTGVGTIKDIALSSGSQNVTVQAGVYGGACKVDGDTCYIYMSGGIVESGIYGGCNVTGTMSGNTHITIVGGQVGTNTQAANVHGGGYGSTTAVKGNVDVAIGTKTRGNCGYTTSGTAVINGDVYGGSALGSVNTDADNHTRVMLNSGTIYGSLYGGGLGDDENAAAVNGTIAVKVYGGTIDRTAVTGAGRTMGSDGYIWGSGGVYGCNNVNGTPASTVAVDIYGTDAAPSTGTYALKYVYGGGNLSAYSGKPTVAVHNCGNSIEYVYGGGNAAAVGGTDVTIWGGDVIGNVFGGGNGNNEGWPDATARASWPSTISDNTSNPGADVNGTAAVKINGGTILNVFGGSNTKGLITGGTSVIVNQQEDANSCGLCAVDASNVYGAGNKAPYTGDTDVQILNGTVGNVFGGGKGQEAAVTGNTKVTIGDADSGHVANVEGNVSGGGDQADQTGSATIMIKNTNTVIGGDVYGGGTASTVASTNTTVYGGTIKGSIFGGGCGNETTNAEVTGKATTTIYGGTYGGIFGAGNISSSIGGGVDILISEEEGYSQSAITADEIYGAGNRATIDCGVDFKLGCLSGMIKELYGGAKACDYGSATKAANINLSIISGNFGKIFGGNNISGNVFGSITVNIEETGCKPIIIDSLYCCGHDAEYKAVNNGVSYGSPTINVTSCTKIGKIFGGGLGANADVTGNPVVNIEMTTGKWASAINNQVGEIGTIFGGGSAADVIGNTTVNIATQTGSKARITDNVYGGGFSADVQGNPTVNIGKQ